MALMVKKHPSFLIVSLRFMGDVLVTTPLARSIKSALPDASIDYLVFRGTERVLIKNPDIRNIITITRGASGLGTLLSLSGKYDVALAAYPSDRTLIAAAIAGKRSIGLTYNIRTWWKKILLNSVMHCNDTLHVVPNMLSLLAPLDITPVPDVVMGYDEEDLAFARTVLGATKYVLIHPYSLKEYKYWPPEQWARLAALIQEQTDCTAVFTRTPEPEGAGLLEKILKMAPPETRAFDAPCTLNQLAALLKNASAYVGIDTAITHVAAALNIPTVALFGPTLSRYWAPWPNGTPDQSPFAVNKGVQRKGYVTVIQKEWECVPCNRETCPISTRNKMECLESISPEEVLQEVLDRVNRTKTA